MEEKHFVRAYLRRPWVAGYWRKRPYTYEQPSLAQLKARTAFAKLMHEKAYRLKGKVKLKGVEMPAPTIIPHIYYKGLNFKLPWWVIKRRLEAKKPLPPPSRRKAILKAIKEL